MSLSDNNPCLPAFLFRLKFTPETERVTKKRNFCEKSKLNGGKPVFCGEEKLNFGPHASSYKGK
jgi:hypothetical protein